MADEVVFNVEIDDSNVESGMKKAQNKVEKIAEDTAKSQTEAQKTVAESAENSNKQIAESAEKAHKKVAQSAEDSAKTQTEMQKSVVESADSNNKEMADSAEKTHKKIQKSAEESAESITSAVSREGDNIVKKNEQDTEKLIKNQSDYEEKAKKTADNVKKFYLAAGAAIVAETTAAIVSASNYQTSYAKVFTLLEDGTNEAQYTKSIKQASKNTGVNVTDMSEAVYSAISASVDQEDAVAFTEDAVKLAKGGFTDTATAVDVLTTAINAYDLSAKDAAHISDVLITTQNAGKTTVDELARSMGQTIPIANSSGAAIEDLSAQYAVLTKNGVATAEAGTKIKAMLAELSSSGTVVSTALKEVTGKSFKELQSEGKNTADILNILSDYASSAGKSISDLFGSTEAGSAALTIIKDGGTDFTNILSQLENSAEAAESAYNKMANTIEAKADKLLNKITIMFAEAGEEMLPLIDELIGYVDDNADEIEDIIKGTGEFIKDLLVTLSDLIKILWDNKEAVAAVAAGFIAYKTAIAISSVIDKFKASTEGATIAQKLLNIAMSANPAALIVGGIAALTVGLISFSAQAESSNEKVRNLSDSVKSLSENASSAVNEQRELENIAQKYQDISTNVEDTAQKKEQLAQLQDRLNNLYGDEKTGIDLVNGGYEEQLELISQLNEKEKAHKINQITNDLAETQKSIKTAEGSQFEINFSVNEKSEEFINGQLNDIYKKWAEKNEWLFTLGGGRDDERNLFIEGNIDEQIALLEELEQAILDSGEASGEFSDVFESIGERLSSLRTLKESEENLSNQLDIITGKTEYSAEVTDDLTDAENDNAFAFNGATSEIANNKLSLDDLSESVNQIITKYSDLSAAIADIEAGNALSYEQLQELISIYPDLADRITLTTEGYIIEQSAVDDLNAALNDSVNVQIEAERQKTAAAIEGAKERIRLYEREAATAGQAGDAEKVKGIVSAIKSENEYIAQLEAEQNLNNSIPEYIRNNGNKSSSSSGGKVTSSTALPEAYTKGKKDLDHQLAMDDITQETYYSEMYKLMEEHGIAADSDEYRAIQEAEYKYKKSKNKTESKKESSGKGKSNGTVISIDSYIPTVWDSEEESNRKIKKALGVELYGESQYGHVVNSIQTSANELQTRGVSSENVITAAKAETTLADVVNAITELQKGDEKRHISLEVEIIARDLSIGKVSIADINDITRMTGKSPLIS